MGEEEDAAPGRLDSLAAEECLELLAQGPRVVAEMVAVAEAERAGTVVAE